MKFYEFEQNGLFKQAHELAEGAELPEHFENCTEVAPPELTEDFNARWNGESWTIERAQSFVSY